MAPRKSASLNILDPNHLGKNFVAETAVAPIKVTKNSLKPIGQDVALNELKVIEKKQIEFRSIKVKHFRL